MLAPVFEWDGEGGVWRPGPLARGPFAGLQGGAVAGLMTAAAERLGAAGGFGAAVSVSAWFLRPAPAAALRVTTGILHAKGRLCVIDSTLFAEGDGQPVATARITFLAARDLSALAPALPAARAIDPASFPERRRAPPVAGPWMMDAMEVRRGPDGVFWFRMRAPIVLGAGPLASVLGPADFAHGLGRPVERVFADPNPTLNVQLLRPPADGWIGVRPAAHWRPETGCGFGAADLIDPMGPIGQVSMSVALAPTRALPPEPLGSPSGPPLPTLR